MSQTVHFQGNPVTVANSIPQAGSKAQTFTLVAKDLSDVTLGQFAGKRKVLNIFPSIDTGVCAASVRKFNQLATEIDNTVVLCNSPDTPARREYPPVPTVLKGSAASVPVQEHLPDKTPAGGYRNTLFPL